VGISESGVTSSFGKGKLGSCRMPGEDPANNPDGCEEIKDDDFIEHFIKKHSKKSRQPHGNPMGYTCCERGPRS
jgi:hypothetical protein